MDTFQTFLNACRNGQKNIVKILLDRGCIDLNRRDAEGNTALHYACRQGFRDIISMLLDHGADVLGPTTVPRLRSTQRPEMGTARSLPDS